MKLTVIIPALNEEKALPKLLNCLRNQTIGSENLEVIVADANSTDNTVKEARNYGAKVVEGGSPAVGRNNGAKFASSPVLIFFDADVEIQRNFLEKALKSFESKDLDIAGGYFAIKKGSLSYIVHNLSANFFKYIRQNTKSPNLSGDFIIIKKDLFERLSGFDESMTIGEDNDLAKRAKKIGANFATIDVRYITSPRRIDQIGLVGLILTFILMTLFSLILIQKNKKVQEFLQKFYGKVGEFK